MYSMILMASMASPGSPPVAPPVDWDRPPGFKSTAPRGHHHPQHVVPVAPYSAPAGCSGYSAPVGCSGYAYQSSSYGCSGSHAESYGGSRMRSGERRAPAVRRILGRVIRRGGCF